MNDREDDEGVGSGRMDRGITAVERSAKEQRYGFCIARCCGCCFVAGRSSFLLSFAVRVFRPGVAVTVLPLRDC